METKLILTKFQQQMCANNKRFGVIGGVPNMYDIPLDLTARQIEFMADNNVPIIDLVTEALRSTPKSHEWGIFFGDTDLTGYFHNLDGRSAVPWIDGLVDRVAEMVDENVPWTLDEKFFAPLYEICRRVVKSALIFCTWVPNPDDPTWEPQD